ncbi:hypothetical protein D018_0824B, partial [Vibrio parahaemolyticus VP2007-007]
LQHQPMIPPSC